MSKHIKPIAALCALSIMGAVSAVSYATAAPDNGQPAATAPAEGQADNAPAWLIEAKEQAMGHTVTTAVPYVQEAITDRFPLFRNQPASPIPDEIAVMVASPSMFGRNAALARRFDTPYGPGWAIPGDGFICITTPTSAGNYGVNCLPPDVAAAKGLWMRTHSNDGKVLETLVLPDRTNVVERTSAGQDSETLTASADGIVSRFIDDGAATPILVPAG